MSTPLVALIIGSGPNVGAHVAQKLKTEGYRVAVGSRNPDSEAFERQGLLPVPVDGTDSKSIKDAFKLVRDHLGEPNVVVYNLSLYVPPKSPNDPLSVSAEGFAKTCSVGSGVLVAAQEALDSFRSSKSSKAPKVFISTGNLLPFIKKTFPHFYALDLQKGIMATTMQYANQFYTEEGFRFHYATLVGPDGGIPNLASDAKEGFFTTGGPAHAEAYWNLISRAEAETWDYRFTYDGKKFG
ncbi:hypothetical protein BDP27DRAFT_1418628 [Rhodocollybia butyracea]|uniref:Uncharacterized protein n=1 Tax=Rhodocollybia butyracea TaxID=206335 RepID=A0A9P5UA97_9AGAR|nr:hypothetical protein BDP27DRAFT_1418628 [Rhodocollybia butyracea]